MNIIDALRAKLDEDPYKEHAEQIEERRRRREDEGGGPSEDLRALAVGFENMGKGRRLGLLEAMELLGCHRSEEQVASHQRMHRAKCTAEHCEVCHPSVRPSPQLGPARSE
jgi:hypothetical protein